MPPSWSTRLLSSNSSSSTPTRKSSRDHPAPPPGARPPPPVQTSSTQTGVYDPPPTLYNVRPTGVTAGSPQQLPGVHRPRTSTGPSGKSTHGRSVSHPLPRIFGRKKSAQDINARSGWNDTDVPLDSGGLVPILTESAPTPTRVISGRKSGYRDGGKGDDDGMAQRRCMCCDVKVSVPRELDKFRCLSCLTVNDLRPIEEQNGRNDEITGRIGAARATRTPVPLSTERTKAIIERCLFTYLESRCRRSTELARDDERTTAATHGDVAGTAYPSDSGVGKPLEVKESPPRVTSGTVVSSPPHTPVAACADTPPLIHSATIRDLTDIDLFSYMRSDVPPPPFTSTTLPGPGHAQIASNTPQTHAATPAHPIRRPPPPPIAIADRSPSQRLNSSYTSNGPRSPRQQHPHGQTSPRPTSAELEHRARHDRARTIFRPLEDYLAATYGDFTSLNTAFSSVAPRAAPPGRTLSESSITVNTKLSSLGPSVTNAIDEEGWQTQGAFDGGLEGLDAKTLLLGELGENSSWWTGKLDRLRSDKNGVRRKQNGGGSRRTVGSKSPNVKWEEVISWYDAVHQAGEGWGAVANRMTGGKGVDAELLAAELRSELSRQEIGEDLAEARDHVNRTLLKITENLLKRPGRPLKEPGDLRWLLIILANPSLFPSGNSGLVSKPPAFRSAAHPIRSVSGKQPALANSERVPLVRAHTVRDGSQHTGIIKRIFGLLAHTPESNHRYLISWLARFDEEHLIPLVDLTSGFVTHRITRSNHPTANRVQRSRGTAVNDGGLIPDLSGSAANTSAQLHSAMGLSGSIGGGGGSKKAAENSAGTGETDWAGDWQVKAAARWMSILFAANNTWQGRRKGEAVAAAGQQARVDSGVNLERTQDSNPHPRAAKSRLPTQLLPTSTFYNISLDYQDLIADFKAWESRRDAKDAAKFSFCQYPLFLSMGSKIKILEYDARRQMEIKAREAYFDSVIRQRALDGYFHLRVRRECMVDDSLRQISEAVGAGQEELKKGLRVHFAGEEGIDAGGPRKEWFLMLVREIFDPEHGMFVYDDESHLCYFNPHSFETSDQFHLVGALLGLAIYNSTILDVALPGFAFRKLMAAAPAAAAAAVGGVAGGGSATVAKSQMIYTLVDLREYRPRLAAGLQQLLDFEGDVESTYCWSFVAPVERFGVVTEVPLISNGEGTMVTNDNRQQFVDAYVRYLLDTSVARQFEPFKRGFFTVCAGNALSLFRAEEIELLVRGSDEELDVDSLRAVAVYENWRVSDTGTSDQHPTVPNPAEEVDVVGWFWELFAAAPAARQRQLLTFITGSDRIPAVGATSLVLRIVAGGDGWGGNKDDQARFPVARTCFNMLVLWRYESKAQLEGKLWRALEESEGFGLK